MYAFTLQHVTRDSMWLERFLRTGESDAIARRILLSRLLRVRRQAANLRFELELWSSEMTAASSVRYQELLSAVTGFAHEPAEYLADLDDGFYSAHYLRAWFFEAQLTDYLKSRYGRCWWSEPRAGDLLKEIWNTGFYYSLDEMAQQLGIGPLAMDALLELFTTALK